MIGTLTATTDAAGQATFGDLSINQSGRYQLLAISGTVSTPSNPFQISASQNTIVITAYGGDGQSAPAGASYASPLRPLGL